MIIDDVNSSIDTITRALPLAANDPALQLRLKQQLGMLLSAQTNLLGVRSIAGHADVDTDKP